MTRDPLYRDILRRLEGPLDPELFEQCAADILRQDFPTLVPIRGGSDAGMDGAIADEKGIAYPLISTTSTNVLGNLSKNIQSYLEGGGTRNKAVLATSQYLTPQRRRNLEKRATEHGFTLIQVYDRHAIADRLYYHPKWCFELLNLTGQAPPLSIFPPSLRPSITEKLIGRDTDLAWLTSTSGDRLFVGQPGSGKTFLLQLWAKENNALFIVRRDSAAIANAIRSQKPNALILDDAHLYKEFLADLIQLRRQIGATFEIIATCWPSYENVISSLLNLASPKVHKLELLSRDEIVEVIKSAGIQGPNRLVRELVDQSQGKPGLAVTLSYLCIHGDVEKVALGDALSRSIRESFESLVGEKAIPVLASFAIGGDSGISIDLVAEFLKLPVVEVHTIATRLAFGGVLNELPAGYMLSVSPQTLRFALVRDVFFSGRGSLNPTHLLESVPNLGDAVISLIAAKARGAIIPSDTLLNYLIRARSMEAWRCYAWLGENEVKTVLQMHPEMLIDIAHAALEHSPETVIPLLIRAAVGDDRPLSSATDHPLRLIEDWIASSVPGSEQVIQRRQALLRATLNGLKNGMDFQICLKALPFVFSLGYQDVSSDPGSGMKINLTHGAVTLNDLKEIRRLWPLVFSEMIQIENVDWNHVIKVLEEIAFPGPVMHRSTKDFYQETREFASEILKNIAGVNEIGLGTTHRIIKIAESLKLSIPLSVNNEFLTLFPVEDLIDWRSTEKRQREAASKLAEEWIPGVPEQIVNKISFYESEARSAGISYPRWTPYVCQFIAQRVTEKNQWAKAVIKDGLTADLLEPFLREAMQKNEVGWEELITQCLENDKLRIASISVILPMPSPSPALLDKVLHQLEGYGSFIETLCLRRQIPEGTLLELLQHPDPSISGNVAIGTWVAEPKGEIGESLKEKWRTAVLNIQNEAYWLGEILKKDETLAFEWLTKHIKNTDIPHDTLQIFNSAIGSLTIDQRKEILKLLPNDFWRTGIVKTLIGDSLDLYQGLLRGHQRSYLHLMPLRLSSIESFGKENEEVWNEEAWVAKAKIALDAGYSPEEIEDAISEGWFWSGKISDMWARWIVFYDKRLQDPDPRIKKVGEIGKAKAKAQYDKELIQEKRESIYGR